MTAAVRMIGTPESPAIESVLMIANITAPTISQWSINFSLPRSVK